MRAFDVMTTSVVSIKPEMTVRETAKIFVEQRISGAPVVDVNGQLVGMISEGDLLHREEIETDGDRRPRWLSFFSRMDGDAQRYVKSHARKVEDVMTSQVISVDETTSLQEIADLLETKHIKRVPVLRAGKLVGIVSRSNLIQALASTSDDEVQIASPSDAEIRALLMGEIAGQKWSYVGRNVVVRDGIVHLWGSVWSSDEIRATRIAAENIPGIKGVEEHIETQGIQLGI